MYSAVLSGALLGMQAYLVRVEVDITSGLPCFNMVGYLGSEVREARERVQVALKNSGIELPPMKITVNLSPADIRKEGTAFDLPVAVGILGSLGLYEPEAAAGLLFLGELGLNGEVKAVKGILPLIRAVGDIGAVGAVLPLDNAKEAEAVKGARIMGVGSLEEVLAFLRLDKRERESVLNKGERAGRDAAGLSGATETAAETEGDFQEICGQEQVRRAAEIAAAGFHNLLMTGPPGTGKSMIARRIPGILPPLTEEEQLEVSAIYSVAGLLSGRSPLITRRPFQSPHHTITRTGLTGGGAMPRPGVVSLAHRGVLFLDELPEFSREVIDSLRQPLEERLVHIARVRGNVAYPAEFILIAARNPCPCGYYPDRNRCTCREHQIQRYQSRVSGPILDRFDLWTEVLPVEYRALQGRREGDSSAVVRERVAAAHRLQRQRYSGRSIRFNGEMEGEDIRRYCVLEPEGERLMESFFAAGGISVRGYHRTLKVARTIADLDSAEVIGTGHLAEAICYRPLPPQTEHEEGGMKV